MKGKILLVAAVFVNSHSFSQSDQPARDSLQSRELETVIVSANKFPHKQSETGKVITLIPASQIAHSGGQSLGELLNSVAGVTINGANNNPGTNQTVSIRGASAGNTLILIDGIPMNDPSVITNYFDLNLLPLEQIDHIEVLKGGQSTLYGSDAVAGVINIILKKSVTRKSAVQAAIAAGSYGTLKETLGIQGRGKTIGYSLGYSHIASKGFTSAYDPSGTGGFERDGYNQHSIDGRLQFQLRKRLQLQVSGQYSYYKAELDAAAYMDEKDYSVRNNNQRAGAGLSWNHRMGQLHFNYHFNRVNRHYTDDSIFHGSPYLTYSDTKFSGITHFAELYNQWRWKKAELVTGADFRAHHTDQSSLFIFPGFPGYADQLKADMSQWSPYATLLLKAGRGWMLEAGGRWNHHSVYGDNFSFTFNPAWQANQQLKIFANLYSAYKVPTLYQLYDPSAGNKNLRPEESIIAELGWVWKKSQAGQLRVTGFYRKTKQAILYSYDPTSYQSLYVNAANQENYGWEAEADFRISKWQLRFNYTFTDGLTRAAYDGTGAPLGKDTNYYNLYRIPRHAGNLFVSYEPSTAFWLEARLRLVSSRQEFIYVSSPETIAGYGVVDLYSEYKTGKGVKIFLDLKNLTNTKYFDIPGYTSRRFNFVTGISLQL